MERHFEHDMDELKQRLLWMASLAERAVHQAVQAVLDTDRTLAEAVLSEETPSTRCRFGIARHSKSMKRES